MNINSDSDGPVIVILKTMTCKLLKFVMTIMETTISGMDSRTMSRMNLRKLVKALSYNLNIL